MISERTSAALQAKKASGAPWVSKRAGRPVGARLGSPTPSKGAAAAGRAVSGTADAFVAKMLPVIDAIRWYYYAGRDR
jgi:hypothetical protein